MVQHDKAHQEKDFKLSYVKFHQKIKKDMNDNIFCSIYYIIIISKNKKRHAKSFKDIAFKLNHIKLDREGLIVI